jgi:SOS response regulatory protein OraA/RecX
MKRRKSKGKKRGRQKLYQGGVVNERPHIRLEDVILKVELAGRRMTTRLVDKNDPYNLGGR